MILPPWSSSPDGPWGHAPVDVIAHKTISALCPVCTCCLQTTQALAAWTHSGSSLRDLRTLHSAPVTSWKLQLIQLLRATLWLSIHLIVVARKLIQESTEFGFNRRDLGPQVRFPLDKLHDLVLAECGCLIVSGTSEQCDHRSCEPMAVATLVYGRQQHGHELPENPSQHQFLRAGRRHLGSLVAGDRGVDRRVGHLGCSWLLQSWRPSGYGLCS